MIRTSAEEVGCCGRASKESCVRPPCPCNLDTYSKQELQAIRKKQANKKKQS